MPKFNVEFANLNIEVNCLYDYTPRYCRDYLTEGTPDFSVTTTEEKIDEEVSTSPYNPKRDYAESICVYREIANRLPEFNRCVYHGAVLSYGGRGYIFTAPSGTGKTTHISLWCKYLKGAEIVNGDKPILHITDDGVTAYATPYAGKEGFQNHSFVGIHGICIIHRGTENKITRLPAGQSVSELIRQMYMPPDTQSVMKSIDLLDLMLKQVPVYLLECDISEDAVRTSFEAMTGEKYKTGESNED